MIVNNFRNIMPIAKDVNEAIFNNQKKHFLLILKKPDIFFEDIHCIGKIEEEWKQFNLHVQKIILKEYKKSSELKTLSLLIINESINHNDCNVQLLDFLLSKGFQFNNEDIINLQINHIIPKLLDDNKKSNLMLNCIFKFFNNIKEKVFSFLKLNFTKNIIIEDTMGIINKLPITMYEVLSEHINSLPLPLKEKLLNDINLSIKEQN